MGFALFSGEKATTTIVLTTSRLVRNIYETKFYRNQIAKTFENKISGHSRTIIGIEQRASGLTLLVLDPSHGPRQVAALGSSRDSLRLIRRNMTAMRAPQYQIVAVKGLFETEEQYQVFTSIFYIKHLSVRVVCHRLCMDFL